MALNESSIKDRLFLVVRIVVKLSLSNVVTLGRAITNDSFKRFVDISRILVPICQSL